MTRKAWLMELVTEPGQYFMMGTTHGKPLFAWTADPDGALQFARRDDVIAFADAIPELKQVCKPVDFTFEG